MATMTEQVALDRIGQIAIRATDIARAVQFYRDTLGMRFLFQVPNLAFFDCGGVRLMLSGAESPEFDHPGSVLYYKVSDIDASYEALRKRGVQFIDQPHLIAKMEDHDLWMVFFRDSEGNTLSLMCEKRR
ncbi:MAG TPA: VOC family protein [Gemmatimonadaceae bacterium]|nr:VOC family protein [Gemmatimonadaceae bacterium]